MKDDIQKLVNLLKKQAEMFLLDAKEFYPFGTSINNQNEIIPVSAYFENDHPSSQDVIGRLEQGLKKGILKGDYKISAIAIDVILNKDNKKYDAIEMRFFERGKDVYKKHFKYEIKAYTVEFTDVAMNDF